MESLQPTKVSASLERSTSGFADRDMSSLPQEDAEYYEKFVKERKPLPAAAPEILSFEEEERLKSPPPEFVLRPGHWMGLHVKIHEKLWQAYRLAHPATFEKAEQSFRVVGAISKSRNELPETKAREVFKQEYRRKRRGYQCLGYSDISMPGQSFGRRGFVYM